MKLKSNGAVTQGKVIDTYEVNNTDINGTQIEVAYMVNHKKYVAMNKVLFFENIYKAGQGVDIIYDKSNPGNSRINTNYELNTHLFHISLGSTLLITCIILIIKRNCVKNMVLNHNK